MLNAWCCYAELRYAECQYAKLYKTRSKYKKPTNALAYYRKKLISDGKYYCIDYEI